MLKTSSWAFRYRNQDQPRRRTQAHGQADYFQASQLTHGVPVTRYVYFLTDDSCLRVSLHKLV